MPPPMREEFVIGEEMTQNNLIQDKGKLVMDSGYILHLFCK